MCAPWQMHAAKAEARGVNTQDALQHVPAFSNSQIISCTYEADPRSRGRLQTVKLAGQRVSTHNPINSQLQLSCGDGAGGGGNVEGRHADESSSRGRVAHTDRVSGRVVDLPASRRCDGRRILHLDKA